MSACLDFSICTWWWCKNHGACLLHQIETRNTSEITASCFPNPTPKNLPPLNGRIIGKHNKYRQNRRRRVFSKTNGKCYICNNPINLKTFTIDHFIPKSKGGSDTIENLMPACRNCNQEKSDKMPI